MNFDIPEELRTALNENPAAKNFFKILAPSLKNNISPGLSLQHAQKPK